MWNVRVADVSSVLFGVKGRKKTSANKCDLPQIGSSQVYSGRQRHSQPQQQQQAYPSNDNNITARHCDVLPAI